MGCVGLRLWLWRGQHGAASSRRASTAALWALVAQLVPSSRGMGHPGKEGVGMAAGVEVAEALVSYSVSEWLAYGPLMLGEAALYPGPKES